MRLPTGLFLAAALWGIAPVQAAAQLRAEVYVSGLGAPLAFVQDPSNDAVQYVVQQGGRIRVIANGQLQPTDFLNLVGQISTGGEQGLLGLAFPPDYIATGRFFVNFTDSSGNTVVARFHRSANLLVADPASRFDLLWPGGQRFIAQPYANHNGGNLVFGPDGYLYIGLGDGGSGDDPEHRAQNPATLLGKMLRIDVSVPDSDPEGYNVPADNPFVGVAGFLPEIWSFGLRNPWRYNFDDPRLGGTGALIIGDVGQVRREEIDYEPAGHGGRNYGWRNREGTLDNVTSLPPAYLPLTDPIFDYGRSSGAAVTGGFVYRGTALGAEYRGRYFFADFIAGRVWSLGLSINPATGEATATDLLEHTAELSAGAPLGAISSFGVDAGGELYLTSFNGTVLRIRRALAPPNPNMFIDVPVQNASASQPFLLAGWAADLSAQVGTGISTLHVWAYPDPGSGRSPIFVGVANYGGVRPDVGAVIGAQFAPSGFGLLVSSLSPGKYRFAVFGWVNAIGNFGIVRTVDLTIVSTTQMVIDLPSPFATVGQPFHLAGWSLDTAASSGTGIDTIHVWAYPVMPAGSPIFVGTPALGGPRPDVGAIFGTQFTPSGYNMLVSGLVPGVYDIVVYSRSTVSNTFDAAQFVRVTVQ